MQFNVISRTLVMFDSWGSNNKTGRVRVKLRIMAMKGYSTFPKARGQEPHHQMQFSVITLIRVAEMLSVYSTTPADWASELY